MIVVPAALLGPSVRLPRQECFAFENTVLGWDGAVPVHQAHGSWKFLVAARGGAWRLGDAGARRNASGVRFSPAESQKPASC